MNYTLSYSEGVQGWTSFFSFYPDWMIGMNNYFYTFKGGNLYRHNVNEVRNNFVNGIGRSLNVSGPAAAIVVDFQITPTPIDIGSILSIGDIVYYCLPPTYSSPFLFGEVTDIVINYPQGDNYIVVDTTTLFGATIPPINDAYIMYIKNSVAESHGVLGHYCVFTLENSNTEKVELFAVESEIMKSYP